MMKNICLAVVTHRDGDWTVCLWLVRELEITRFWILKSRRQPSQRVSGQPVDVLLILSMTVSQSPLTAFAFLAIRLSTFC